MALKNAKKITASMVASWALALGLTGLLGILSFNYLAAQGLITITGYSGDMRCGGGIPCIAEINFTTGSSNLTLSAGIWDLKIPEAKTVSGLTFQYRKLPSKTWVSLNRSKSDLNLYSDSSYSVRYTAYKSPYETVKWGFGPIDPSWLGVNMPTNGSYTNSSPIFSIAMNFSATPANSSFLFNGTWQYCSQEWANYSNLNSVCKIGTANGTNNASAFSDGSWTTNYARSSTAGTDYIYENYTIPLWANTSSMLESGLASTMTRANSTFSSWPGCWNTGWGKLAIRCVSVEAGTPDYSAIDCQNQTDGIWYRMRTTATGSNAKRCWETQMYWVAPYLIRFNETPQNNTNWIPYTASGLTDGGYYMWNATVSNGGLNESNPNFFTVDAVAPTPTIYYTANNTHSSNNTFYFGILPTDGRAGLSTCAVYANWTGSWAINITNTTPYNNSFWNGSVNGIPNGLWRWTAYCNDTVNNKGWAASNWTIAFDSDVPIVKFVSPTWANNSYQRQTWATLNATGTNALPTAVWANINGTVNGTLHIFPMDYYNTTGVLDLAGNGGYGVFTGTNFGVNNITPAWYGKGINFGNATQAGQVYLDLGDRDEFSIGTAGLTIGFWMAVNNLTFFDWDSTGYCDFVSRATYDPVNTFEWQFRLYNLTNTELRPNRISVYAFNTSGGLGVGSYFQDTVTVGEWFYVVGVINSSDPAVSFTKLYKNGVLRDWDPLAALTITPQNTDAHLWIGRPASDLNKCPVQIDNFFIVNRTLSDAEINATYQSMSGNYLVNFTNLPDGVYRFDAYAADYGGWTASNTTFFTLDNVVPTVRLPLYTNATVESADKTLTINVSIADGTSGPSNQFCYVWIGAGSNTSVAMSSGWCNTTTIPLTGQTAGNKTISIYANDSAGNAAVNNSYVVWIDAASPVVTLPVYANATRKKNTESLTLNISVVDAVLGSSGPCKVSLNGGANQTVAMSGIWCNTTGISLAGLSDGNMTIAAYGNDSVGLFGINNSYVVQIDSTTPSPYLLAPTTGSSQTNDTFTYQVKGTDNIALSYLAIYTNFTGAWLPTVVNSSAFNNSVWTGSLTIPSFGTYKWTVWANDTTGNSLFNDTNWTVTYTLAPDSQAPSIALNNPANDNNTNLATVPFDITITDNKDIKNVSIWSNWTGSWALNASNSSVVTNNTAYVFSISNIPDGIHRWSASACDYTNNCNYSFSENRTITVDRTAPVGDWTGPTPNNNSVQKSGDIALNFTGTFGYALPAVVQYLYYRLSNESTFSSTMMFTVTDVGDYYELSVSLSGLSDGTRIFRQEVIDAAGNSMNSSDRYITIDNELPLSSILAPSDASVQSNDTLAFICNSTDNYALNYTMLYTNTSGWAPVVLNNTPINNTEWSGMYTLPSLGSYLFACAANDTVGNLGFSASNYTVTWEAAGLACGALSAPGVYTMTENLTTAGDCFTITSDNVTLDCADYTINGTDGSTTQGVLMSGVGSNITIQNCRFANLTYGVAASNTAGTCSWGENPYQYNISNFYVYNTTNALYLWGDCNGTIFVNNGNVNATTGTYSVATAEPCPIIVNNVTSDSAFAKGMATYPSNITNSVFSALTDVDCTPPTPIFAKIENVNISTGKVLLTENVSKVESTTYASLFLCNLKDQWLSDKSIVVNTIKVTLNGGNNSINNVSLLVNSTNVFPIDPFDYNPFQQINITNSQFNGSELYWYGFTDSLFENNTWTLNSSAEFESFAFDSVNSSTFNNNTVTVIQQDGAQEAQPKLSFYSFLNSTVENSTITLNATNQSNIFYILFYGGLNSTIKNNNISNYVGPINTMSIGADPRGSFTQCSPQPNRIYNNWIRYRDNGLLDTPVKFEWEVGDYCQDVANFTNYWNQSAGTGLRPDGRTDKWGGNLWENVNVTRNTSLIDYRDCTDADNDGICDLAWDVMNNTYCTPGINCTSPNIDFLPLSNKTGGVDSTPPFVQQISPANNTITPNNTLNSTVYAWDNSNLFNVSVNGNFTKRGAQGLKWMIKYYDSVAITSNLTIPDSCFNYYSDRVVVNVTNNHYDNGTFIFSWFNFTCYNGTWALLNSTTTDDPSGGSAYFYEDAAYWNMTYLPTWCYQETANVSTACGGVSTGSYFTSNWNAASNLYDGSWLTSTDSVDSGIPSQFTITYMKPIDAYTVNSTPYNNTNTTFPLLAQTDNYYSWNATACDSSGNCNTTANMFFTIDTTAPKWFSNATTVNPATHPVSYAEFNLTVNDSLSGVDSVWIDFNGVNYTTGKYGGTGSIYTFNRSNPTQGTYPFRWWMNDAAGNRNNTASLNYVVNKGILSGVLTVPAPPATSPFGVNFTTNNLGDGDVNYTLYRNGTFIGSANLTDSPSAGYYVYVLNSTGGANYTANSSIDSKSVTISSAGPQWSNNLTTTNPITYTYTNYFQANITVTDASLAAVTMSFNGVNYSTISLGGDLYSFNISNLAAGTYPFIWYMNNTIGNYNSTPLLNYVINKAIPTGSISGSDVVYPNAVSVTPSETNSGDSDITYYLWRNSTLVSQSTGSAPSADTSTLAASYYLYTLNSSAGTNYTVNASIFTKGITVSKGPVSLTHSLNTSATVTYPVAVQVSGSNCNAQLSCRIIFAGTDVGTTPYSVSPAVGTYVISYNASSNENYTVTNSTPTTLTVNKGTPAGTLAITNSTYPTGFTATPSETNQGDGDVTYTVYCGPTTQTWTGSALIFPYSAGTYTCVFNSTAGANWTANSNLQTQAAKIDKATVTLTHAFNESTPQTYPKAVQVTGGNCNSNITCALYRNGTSVGDTPFNWIPGSGAYLWSYNSSGNENYTVTNSTPTQYNIDKGTQTGTLMISNSTYPVGFTATPTITSSTLGTGGIVYTVYGGPTTQTWTSGSLIFNYKVGTYSPVVFNATGNENWTANVTMISQTAKINVAVLTLTHSFNASTPQTYPVAIAVTGSGCNTNVTCALYRNGTSVGDTPYVWTPAVGSYLWSYNSSGNENYTSTNSTPTQFNIGKGTPIVRLVTNATSGTFPLYLNVTGTVCTSPLSCSLLLNGTVTSNAYLSYPAPGYWNFTYHTDGNDNYTAYDNTTLVLINNGTLAGSILVSTPRYGIPFSISYNEMSPFDGGVNYTIYRNGTYIGGPQAANLCYQESVNSSTVGDGTCGLQYTGNYSVEGIWTDQENAMDGNWSSYGLPISGATRIWINYTTPANMVDAIWQVKVGYQYDSTSVLTNNITLGKYGCFDSSVVQLDLRSSAGGGGYVELFCYTGTDWVSVYYKSNYVKVFEEALYWVPSQATTDSPINGYYQYVLNSTGGTNYTANTSIDQISVTVNTAPPTPYLILPEDSTTISATTVSFTVRANSSLLSYIVIYSNKTGTWAPLAMNSSPINGVNWTISVPGFSKDTYIWSVWANDTSGNSVFNDTNRTFIIDVSPPNTYLLSPVDYYNQSSTTATFSTKAVSDLLGYLVVYANFSGTWAPVATNSSPFNDTIWTTSVSGLSQGRYVWSSWANSTLGTFGFNDTNRTITIDNQAPNWSNNVTQSYASPCLQETANVSTSSNLACVLSSAGTYYFDSGVSWVNQGQIYDENYNTGGSAPTGWATSAYITYIPPVRTTNAIWQVKSGYVTQNFSLYEYGCFNASNITLKMTSYNRDTGSSSKNALFCWNGTGYKQIYDSGYVNDDIYAILYEEGLFYITTSDSTVFNLTITDNLVGVDKAWLTIDSANYTAFNPSGAIFSYNASNLGVGSHTYRWWMNDTLGNTNNTASLTQSISKVPITLGVSINTSSSFTYTQTVQVTGQNCNTELTCRIYKNGVDVGTSPYTFDPAGGNYVFTYNATDSQNYTVTNSSTATLTVNKANPGMTASVNVSSGTYPFPTLAQGTSCPGQISCSFYLNSSGVANPHTTILGAGYWNYTYQTSGNENYSAGASSAFVTVSKAVVGGSLAITNSTFPTGFTTTPTESNGGDSDVTYTVNCGPTVQTWTSGALTFSYAAGTYTCTFNSTSGVNYTANSSIAIQAAKINKATATLSVASNTSTPVSYPQTVRITGSGCNSELTCRIYRNSSDVGTSPYTFDPPVGAYLFSYNATDSQNYTVVNSTPIVQSITTATLTGSISGTDVTYPNPVSVTPSETNAGDGDITYYLWRNGTLVSQATGNAPTADTSTLAATYYLYILNASSGANYSTNPSIYTKGITINKGSLTLTVASNTSTPATYPQAVQITGSGCVAQITCNIYKNASSVGTTPYSFSPSVGTYLFGYNSTGNENYTVTNATTIVQAITAAIPQGSISGADVTYPASVSVTPSETNGGDSDVTYYLYRNSTLVSQATGSAPSADTANLAANYYLYVLNSSSGANYTANSSIYTKGITVSRGTLGGSMVITNTTFPTGFSAAPSESNAGDGDVTYTVNCGLTVQTWTSGSLLFTYPAGTYTCVFNATIGTNWTANANIVTHAARIDKATVGLTHSFNASTPQIYPVSILVTGSNCNSNITCALYKNGTSVGDTPYVWTPTAGSYLWSYNGTSTVNYTTTNSTPTQFNINKASPSGSISGNNVTYPSAVAITPTKVASGDGDVVYYFYRNSTLVSQNTGASPAADTSTLTAGLYIYTLNSSEGTNFSANSSIATRAVMVSKGALSGTLDITNSTYPTGFTATPSESNGGDGDVTYTVNCGPTVQTWTGSPLTFNYAASTSYTCVFNATSGVNYTANSNLQTQAAKIDKATPTCSLSQADNTYGNWWWLNITSAQGGTGDVYFKMYANSVAFGGYNLTADYVTQVLADTPLQINAYALAAGAYTLVINTTGGQNYTTMASCASQAHTISKAASTVSLPSFSNSTYPTPNAYSFYTLPQDGTFYIWTNASEYITKVVSGGLPATGNFGLYAYGAYRGIVNFSGDTNYTASSNLYDGYFTMSKGASSVYTYINNSRANKTIEQFSKWWINGTRQTGEGTIQLYYNNTLNSSGASPLTANVNFSSVGMFNVTTFYPESQNYTASFETWWANVTDTKPPTALALVSPTYTNNSNQSKTYIYTNLTFFDDNPAGCVLGINGTNYTMTYSNLNCYYNATGQDQGLRAVTVWAYDTFGNYNSTRYFVTLDTVAPNINLVSPPNGGDIVGGYTTLVANGTDASTAPSCARFWTNAYGGWQNVALNCTPSTGYVYSYNLTGISGVITWSVSMNDTLNNTNMSFTNNWTASVKSPVSLSLTSSVGWTNYTNSTPLIVGSGCPTTNNVGVVCNLYKDGAIVSNPFVMAPTKVGVYNFTYNTSGGTYWSSGSISYLLTITCSPGYVSLAFNNTNITKYEEYTTSLVEAYSCTAGAPYPTVCINFPDYRLGNAANCSTNSTTVVWNVTSLQDRRNGDNSTVFNITNTNRGFNTTLFANATVVSANLTVFGYSNGTAYPRDVLLDVGNDSRVDISLPGEVQGTYVIQSRDSSGVNSFNFSLTSGTTGSSGSFSIPLSKGRTITASSFNLTGFQTTISVNGSDNLNSSSTNYVYTTCNTSGNVAKQNATLSNRTIPFDTLFTDVPGSHYGGNYGHTIGDAAIDNNATSAARLWAYTYADGTYSSGELASGSINDMYDIAEGDVVHISLVRNGRVCSASSGLLYVRFYLLNPDTSTWDERYEYLSQLDNYCAVPSTCTYETGTIEYDLPIPHPYAYFGRAWVDVETASKTLSGGCSSSMTGSTSMEVMLMDIYNTNKTRYYKNYTRGFGSTSEYAQSNIGYYAPTVGTYRSTELITSLYNITKVYIEVNESKPNGDNISYYFSPNNGTTWYKIYNGTTTNLTGATGKNGIFMATFNSTTYINDTSKLYNYTLVFNYTSEVTNPKVFLQGSTTPFWSYNGTFNITANVTASTSDVSASISSCTTANCTTTFTLSSDLPGILGVDNINFTYLIDPLSLNITAIQNDLIADDKLVIASNAMNANLSVTNLSILYNGGKNVTVRGNTSTLDNNKTVQILYSNFNLSYPQYISRIGFTPTSRTQANITPTGQTSTQPIVTFKSVVLHPFYLYESLNSTPNACYNMTISNTSSKSNGLISNTTKQFLTKVNNTFNGTGWIWLDITACDPRWLTNSYKWSVLCEGCIGT